MFKHHDALKDAELAPLWHDPDIMPEAEPSLRKDETCELLIVGGGFTGLWAALQAKEREPEADVILIEQTFVGDGASGRNGGFLSSSIAHGETNTEAQFPGEAEKIEALGRQNITELLETLERYGIDARYEETGETILKGMAELHLDIKVAILKRTVVAPPRSVPRGARDKCNLSTNRMMQPLQRMAGESIDNMPIDKQFASGTDFNRCCG